MIQSPMCKTFDCDVWKLKYVFGLLESVEEIKGDMVEALTAALYIPENTSQRELMVYHKDNFVSHSGEVSCCMQLI